MVTNPPSIHSHAYLGEAAALCKQNSQTDSTETPSLNPVQTPSKEQPFPEPHHVTFGNCRTSIGKTNRDHSVVEKLKLSTAQCCSSQR